MRGAALLAILLLAVAASATPGGAGSLADAVAPVQWAVALNGNEPGSVKASDGVLDMDALPEGAAQLDFPYATAADGLFPASGDFTLAFTITYKQFRPNGDGVVVLDADGKGLFWVWGDARGGVNAGLQGFPWSATWDSPDAAERGTPSVNVKPAAGAHQVTLALHNSTMTLAVDGIERLSATTAQRPASLWAGHPTVGQLAGLTSSGLPPVKEKVSGNGTVLQRWWGGGPDVWTTFSLAAVRVQLPEPRPCPVLAETDAEASPCCTVAGHALSAGLATLRIAGTGCLGAAPKTNPGAGIVGIVLAGTVEAQGEAVLSLGAATLAYRAGADAADLDATVSLVKDAADLTRLPQPLPKAALQMPEAARSPYIFLEAIQVTAAADPPAGAFESVAIELRTEGAPAVPDGATLTVLYWDGASWVDTQAHVGGTIQGHGEPDLHVFAATAAADGSGASVVVNHTSTYMLAAKPAPASLSPPASGIDVPWPWVVVGAVLSVNLALGITLGVLLKRRKGRGPR